MEGSGLPEGMKALHPTHASIPPLKAETNGSLAGRGFLELHVGLVAATFHAGALFCGLVLKESQKEQHHFGGSAP